MGCCADTPLALVTWTVAKSALTPSCVGKLDMGFLSSVGGTDLRSPFGAIWVL